MSMLRRSINCRVDQLEEVKERLENRYVTVTRPLDRIYKHAVATIGAGGKGAALRRFGLSPTHVGDLDRIERICRRVGLRTLFEKMRLTATELQSLEKLRSVEGLIRTQDAQSLGVRKAVLYSLYQKGVLLKVSPGCFWRADAERPVNQDYFLIFARCPEAVVCLDSALAFYGLSDEIPGVIHLALPVGSRAPEISWPPVVFHHFSEESFHFGVQEQDDSDMKIRIFSKEKAIADAFKFRRHIGKNVAIEALRRYLSDTPAEIDLLMDCARVCRVESVMRPYLEALLPQ